MQPTPIPFDRFAAEIIRLYEPPHRAPSTKSEMKGMLHLLDRLGVENTSDLTPGLVALLIESDSVTSSPRTVQKHLRYLRVIVNYAVASGYLSFSPFALRKVSQWLGRVPAPAAKKHFSREEIRRVLALMARDVEATQGWAQWRARRLYALTATVAYCGLRSTEALFLHAADIDQAGRIVNLTDRGRAGGRRLKTAAAEAPVPIPEALVPILASWLDHRLDAPADFPIPLDCPWLFPTLNRRSNWTSGAKGTKPRERLQAAAERAGVTGLTFLALRHSWATHAEFHGYGPALIQRVLRHTSERTAAEWYRHADVPNLVERVAEFDF